MRGPAMIGRAVTPGSRAHLPGALLVAALLAAALAAAPLASPPRSPSGAVSAARARASGDSWRLSTTSPTAAAAAPAYLGNGYVGTRVPASGAGFVTAPVATETHVAGVYADVPDPVHGGLQRQGSVNLPGWTELDVVVGDEVYAVSAARAYRQVLDLRAGVLTTSATWAVGGRVSDLDYQVLLDRGRQRVGLVRLRVTPHWSGTLQVRDVLGAGAGLTPHGLHPLTVRATPAAGLVAARTAGIGTVVAQVARLAVPAGSGVQAQATPTTMSATRVATIPVRSGGSYEVTKVVGFATSLDARDPLAVAATAALGAPPADTLVAENAAAWQRLWDSDIVLPGQPTLQARVHAAQFSLLASARSDVARSIAPAGLSSGGYNDHIFWDAETWIYPALLAQHPAEAATVVDYRYLTLAGARRNAAAGGYPGLRYAWESALTGEEVTPTWAETGRLEQHVSADVALAQWQYYQASGDRDWLAARGWPVLSGVADFWAARVARGTDRRYHLRQVEGPDEENWPVDDSVSTNVAVRRALQLAVAAAAVLGRPSPQRWSDVAQGLAVLPPSQLPASGAEAGAGERARPEFSGYAGQQVKQADVVLLSYPWEFPQSPSVERADLEYYTPRYDPDGPAMTDSVHSIVAARLGLGCSDWTFTRRSLDPFVKGPYEQFTEARSGQGAFTFLTGEGGFLQEFLYGYPGLRWRTDGVRFDPTLPPQLAGGLSLTGLSWQGRVFDVTLGPATSTLTLRSGAAMRIETPSGDRRVAVDAPLTLPTRGVPPSADDLARCRPVTANAADASAPAEAAVDGSLVTAWSPGTDPATPSTLTIELAKPSRLTRASLFWQRVRPLAAYDLQIRGAGTPERWQTVASVAAGPGLVDRVTFPAVVAEAVRILLPATRFAGKDPRLAEITVSD